MITCRNIEFHHIPFLQLNIVFSVAIPEEHLVRVRLALVLDHSRQMSIHRVVQEPRIDCLQHMTSESRSGDILENHSAWVQLVNFHCNFFALRGLWRG